jgi:hypothetical protein
MNLGASGSPMPHKFDVSSGRPKLNPQLFVKLRFDTSVIRNLVIDVGADCAARTFSEPNASRIRISP